MLTGVGLQGTVRGELLPSYDLASLLEKTPVWDFQCYLKQPLPLDLSIRVNNRVASEASPKESKQSDSQDWLPKPEGPENSRNVPSLSLALVRMGSRERGRWERPGEGGRSLLKNWVPQHSPARPGRWVSVLAFVSSLPFRKPGFWS